MFIKHFSAVNELDLIALNKAYPPSCLNSANQRNKGPAVEGSQILVAAFDEVGRGCVAGPVAAGCSLWVVNSLATPSNPTQGVALETQQFPSKGKSLAQLNTASWTDLAHSIDDSKKLSEKKRLAVTQGLINLCPVVCDSIFVNIGRQISGAEGNKNLEFILPPELRKANLFKTAAQITIANEVADSTPQDKLASKSALTLLSIGIGGASAREIDEENIWGAVQLAMARAFSLARIGAGRRHGVQAQDFQNATMLVDGNLPIVTEPAFRLCNQVLATSGDARFLSLGVSSIVAKVIRDLHMIELNETFPDYFFAKNKGYGTAQHLDALQKFPRTPLHRASFLKNY